MVRNCLPSQEFDSNIQNDNDRVRPNLLQQLDNLSYQFLHTSPKRLEYYFHRSPNMLLHHIDMPLMAYQKQNCLMNNIFLHVCNLHNLVTRVDACQLSSQTLHQQANVQISFVLMKDDLYTHFPNEQTKPYTRHLANYVFLAVCLHIQDYANNMDYPKIHPSGN